MTLIRGRPDGHGSPTSRGGQGLAGVRYLLAVAILMALASGSVLGLVGAGVRSLDQWPATPGGSSRTDPFITYAPAPAERAPAVGGRLPISLPACWSPGIWQVAG